LILAAGEENGSLLPQTSPVPVQQIIKTFMLVVESAEMELNHVAGFFPGSNGIFIAPRRNAHGETVWLLGDKQRRPASSLEFVQQFTASEWFATTRPHIETIAPSLYLERHKLRWGIYEARKAEAWNEGKFPKSYGVYAEAYPRVLGVWPTLLTLAPLTGKDDRVASALQALRKNLWTSAEDPWLGMRRSPDILDEKWLRSRVVSWDEFQGLLATSA
jgi:hypothetical protein